MLLGFPLPSYSSAFLSNSRPPLRPKGLLPIQNLLSPPIILSFPTLYTELILTNLLNIYDDYPQEKARD